MEQYEIFKDELSIIPQYAGKDVADGDGHKDDRKNGRDVDRKIRVGWKG